MVWLYTNGNERSNVWLNRWYIPAILTIRRSSSHDDVTLTIVIKPEVKHTISKSRFKSRAPEYFRQVEQSRKPLIITDRGKPVLKIVPFSEGPEDVLKELRHSVIKYKDPTQPAGEADWEALR